MPIEIERKFLVVGKGWRKGASRERITQGYISASSSASVRVRSIGKRAFLTIKSGQAGLVRAEYEYEIPPSEGEELLSTLCTESLINKARYTLVALGRTWTIDEYGGRLAGLIIAEVELSSIDEIVSLPSWIGAEVTGHPGYLNSSLSWKGLPAGSHEGAKQ